MMFRIPVFSLVALSHSRIVDGERGRLGEGERGRLGEGERGRGGCARFRVSEFQGFRVSEFQSHLSLYVHLSTLYAPFTFFNRYLV